MEYSREIMERVAEGLFLNAGTTYAIVDAIVEAEKTACNVTAKPILNSDVVAIETMINAGGTEVLLSVRWDMIKFFVTATAIDATSTVLGTAQLATTGSFSESYSRIENTEVKAAIRNWFDAISMIDVTSLKPIGSIYNQPAPVPEENVDTPRVEAEIVSEEH